MLVFAGIVIRTASRKLIRPRAVWPLVEGDLAWIVATATLMAFRVFSPAGNWLFGECACIVLLLALGELLGLRRLRMWTAPLILVVVAVGAVFWTEANAFADLRPTSWKHNEPSTQDMSRGRVILAMAAERHGAAALRAFRVMDYVALDQWSESFPAKSWWPARIQKVRHELLLGTFTSRAELLDGPRAGEIWGIQTWSPYKCRPGDSVPQWLSRDPAINFYLPTLQYFAELPFRLAAAQNVAWAGERVHRGRRFDVVLATWGGFAPHARDDQYEICKRE